MKNFLLLHIILFGILLLNKSLYSQEEEPTRYYQMEPLDDSLFIQIQNELYIDPPDPKAEIVVDLRDEFEPTLSVKGTLYPMLALMPETRSKIITYPFKLNLEEQVNFGSVFTRVADRLKFEKIIDKPTPLQISSTLGYINPYVQLMGGERFGFSIKKDLGLSLGFGTPYSGPLETNFIEANLHFLGLRIGIFNSEDAFIDLKESENHNNLFVTEGIQLGYVIPLGNFFEIAYTNVTKNFFPQKIGKYTSVEKANIVINEDGSVKYQAYLLTGSYINWEFRYPVRISGATRGKFYTARYLDEWHVGYLGHELSLAGSVFDFRLDAMVSSPVRRPQLVCDVIIQQIFDYWSFSAIALGPSFILSTTSDGSFGITSIFFNLRIKVGSSL